MDRYARKLLILVTVPAVLLLPSCASKVAAGRAAAVFSVSSAETSGTASSSPAAVSSADQKVVPSSSKAVSSAAVSAAPAASSPAKATGKTGSSRAVSSTSSLNKASIHLPPTQIMLPAYMVCRGKIYKEGPYLTKSDLGGYVREGNTGYFLINGVDPDKSVAVCGGSMVYQKDAFMEDSFVWNGRTYRIFSPSDASQNIGESVGKAEGHALYAIKGVPTEQKIAVHLEGPFYTDAIAQAVSSNG